MIYNLINYLKTEFPTESFYTGVEIGVKIPNRRVLVVESGGDSTPWFEFTQKTIQILCRDIDYLCARELVYKIYDKINSKFGLVFSAVTVKGETFPEIQINQISSLQLPASLGADENGRIEFTSNYKVVYVK